MRLLLSALKRRVSGRFRWSPGSVLTAAGVVLVALVVALLLNDSAPFDGAVLSRETRSERPETQLEPVALLEDGGRTPAEASDPAAVHSPDGIVASLRASLDLNNQVALLAELAHQRAAIETTLRSLQPGDLSSPGTARLEAMLQEVQVPSVSVTMPRDMLDDVIGKLSVPQISAPLPNKHP